MANIGYRRVSSVDQNPDRQLEGVTLDKVFTDKMSGVNQQDRPGWLACLDYIRDGDVLHVHSMDRLARSVLDLRQIVDSLTDQGIDVKFHKENLLFSKSAQDPLSTLLLHVIGAVAEFERELIRERQREGIALSKKKGKVWGRPRALSDDDKIAVVNMWNDGYSKNRLAQEFNVSRATIHRACKERENSE
jgi:DNA invertase Pin-like site-specific DNA recombinase